jgi:hypothetical protein
MGGAIAHLCLLDAKFHFNVSEAYIYTYGSPRVGDLGFAVLMNNSTKEHHRFTHNRDIVPSMPPAFLGFHHAAREVWIVDMVKKAEAHLQLGLDPGPNTDSQYLECDETGEDPTCHNNACYLGLCTSITDHMLYMGIHMYHDIDECDALPPANKSSTASAA